MKIALINTISKTVDRPAHWWQLFGRTIEKPLESDAEVNFLKLADAIARLGHECHVFVADDYRPEKSVYRTGKLKVHYLKSVWRALFPPGYYPLLRGLSGELKSGGFDVVQSSELMQPSTIVAALASKRVFVWHEQDRYSTRWWLKLIQIVYFNTLGRLLARRVIFIPRTCAAKNFLTGLGYRNVKDVVPNAVDARREFRPLGTAPEHILAVTRLAPDKGLDFLLDAMALVVKELPAARLVIKGDGPYRGRVEARIEELGLKANVAIIRERLSHEELNRLYNKSFFTVIATRGGIFPYVAVESMAAGKPVVSSFARGLKDVIVDGHTGFLVGSEDDMAMKIVFLMKNEDGLKKMSEEARKTAEGYDVDPVAGAFVELFESFVKKMKG